ncbi:hypothetical protein ACFQ6S_24980 [Streptomyces sp. NPDC056479]|uniref:hypothetical protein n=1 Tax=Streptomyces sp. NPDC056479 TaxID=3345832 RepID=UPI0036A27CFA
MKQNDSLVRNVNQFDFIAYIPPVMSGMNSEGIVDVAQAVYVRTLEVLDVSGFHHESDLDLLMRDSGFEVNFSDADLGFRFGLVGNQIFLSRQGSSLSRFEQWYENLMPSLGVLISSLLTKLKECSGWSAVPVLRAQYVFNIIAFDFHRVDGEGDGPIENSRIISKLIAGIPGDDGSIIEQGDQTRHSGRVDYKVSRWTNFAPKLKVRQVYDVSAPGNLGYTTLWFTLSVVGETFEEVESNGKLVRRGFDFSRFTSDRGLGVYRDFFLDKFINHFIGTLCEGYRFETTASSLP